jgi:hypothetical protein
MSRTFSPFEWEMAEQARDELKADAIRRGGRYTREQLANRIGELKQEWRQAHKWRERAMVAERELAALKSQSPGELISSPPVGISE